MISEVFADDKKEGYIVVQYKGKTNVLALQTSSPTGTVEDLLVHLQPEQVQYALVRIKDKKAGVDTTRDVFISWVGPQVSAIEKGKKSMYIKDIKDVLQPFHAALEAVSKENFTEVNVRDKSDPLSGSHFIN